MGGVAETVGRIFAAPYTLGLSEVASGILSKPNLPPTPSIAKPPQIPGAGDLAGANDAAQAARRAARNRAGAGGRRGSILTSPLGLTEPADTAKRMLLGR